MAERLNIDGGICPVCGGDKSPLGCGRTCTFVEAYMNGGPLFRIGQKLLRTENKFSVTYEVDGKVIEQITTVNSDTLKEYRNRILDDLMCRISRQFESHWKEVMKDDDVVR